MAKTTSVRKNFIMNFILTISNFIFPLITFPYVTRVLGASGVGTVTFATSIMTYFSMLGMMGIPTYGIRAVAKVRDDKAKLQKTVKEIIALNAIVMGVALGLFLITLLLVDRLNQEKGLYIILATTLIFNVIGVDWLYKGLEKYSYITTVSIVFKFISVCLLFFLVRTSDDYVMYGLITVVAAVGSNLLNFINLRKLVSFSKNDTLNIKQHLKPTLTFFLLTVSTTIYLNVDTTMLGFIKNDEAVGYYSAAVKIKQILVSVVTSLGAVLLPRLSYHHEQGNRQEFARLTKKALNFVFLTSIPMVVYFILVSRQAIVFLSGEAFLPAVLPMQFIMPTVIFIGLSNLMGMQILVPTNRERLVVYSTLAGAAMDILVNIFLIPAFGASGAAIAGTIAELTVALVQFFVIKEFMIPIIKEIQFDKLAISLLMATLVLIFVKDLLQIGIFLQLAITAVLFFGVYGILLMLLKEEQVTEIFDAILSKMKVRKL